MSGPGAADASVVRAAGEVAHVVDTVFAACDAAGAAFADLWRATTTTGRRPTRADLDPLRGTVIRILADHPHFAGCGAVVAPGLLADAERHLTWWERGAHDDAPVRLVLDLDPAGEDSYDYPRMHWFAVPARERRRAVSGPYVDFRGANRYVYTFATPVVCADAFVGVGGADVPVEALEPLLLQALDPLTADALVVTADRRVVVANTGRWTPGSRLRSFPAVGAQFSDVVDVAADLGWVLATGPPDPDR